MSPDIAKCPSGQNHPYLRTIALYFKTMSYVRDFYLKPIQLLFQRSKNTSTRDFAVLCLVPGDRDSRPPRFHFGLQPFKLKHSTEN